MRTRLEHTLRRAWTQRGALAKSLLIVSWVYVLLVRWRRSRYASGAREITRLPVTVIVVGNVVVGGAGKTPTVIAIVEHLLHLGYRVGVISRGYGRQAVTTLAVETQTNAACAGDEPLLVRRRTGVPVWVGPSRARAAESLLARHPETQILVCDDGLQHYGIARDLEICVFDDSGVGNGWLLPAGPLREPWPRHLVARSGQQEDRMLVLHTGANPVMAGFIAHRSLAPFAINATGVRRPLASFAKPDCDDVIALAAIAVPDAFFDMLERAGLRLARRWALPDHDDLSGIKPGELAGMTVLCTEKDAVKLWRTVPQAWAVPLVQTLAADFTTVLELKVRETAGAPLSLPHGYSST